MKWYVRIGNGLLILFFILFISFAYIMDALAAGRTYVPSDQIDKKPGFTTCRLAAKKIYNETKYCIYRGANGTYEQLSVPKFELCVKEFQCKYIPRDGKKETIKDIMEALERNMR